MTTQPTPPQTWVLIYTGRDRTTDLDVVPRRVVLSMRDLRDYLVRVAMTQWGGPEGQRWAIAQAPHGTLIPIYARNRQTGDTLHIA